MVKLKRSRLRTMSTVFAALCIYCAVFDEIRTLDDATHRRRIYTEVKANFVAAAWGTELFQFLAAEAILHQDSLKIRMICTRTIWRIGRFAPGRLKNRILTKEFVNSEEVPVEDRQQYFGSVALGWYGPKNITKKLKLNIFVAHFVWKW